MRIDRTGYFVFTDKNVIIHGRTKGSRNGISTTPGYKAIGELANEDDNQSPDNINSQQTNSYSNLKNTLIKSVSNGKEFVKRLNVSSPDTNSQTKNEKRDYKHEVDTKVQQAIRSGDQSYFGQGGTVDLNRRPVIPSDWLVEMGYDAEPGGTATVFSHSTSIGENGEHAVTVTPILPNGDVLERDVIEDVLDNIYLGRDGQPHLDGDDWGFELSDILISHYDVSDIPPNERSNFINAMANGLHEVQEVLYQDAEPISEPTWDIPSLEERKIKRGKDLVQKMLNQWSKSL